MSVLSHFFRNDAVVLVAQSLGFMAGTIIVIRFYDAANALAMIESDGDESQWGIVNAVVTACYRIGNVVNAIRFYTWFAIRSVAFAKVDVRYYSALIDRHTRRYGDLRQLFEHPIQQIPAFRNIKTHTHGFLAAIRSSSNMLLSQTVLDAGYIPYHVSCAKSDIGDGNRYYYFPKDLKLAYRDDPLLQNHALIFTDVDYYADMEFWMRKCKPILLYTLCPEYAAYKGKEYAYTIQDDKVEFYVDGGARYKHEIWDYDYDILTVVNDDWSLTTFDVVQKKISLDENRRLIILTPASRTAWPYWKLLDQQPLVRKKYSVKSTNVVRNKTTGEVSLARSGSFIPIKLREEVYEACRIRVANKGNKALISDVERMLMKEKVEEPHNVAPVLFEMLMDVCSIKNQINTSTVTVNFQTLSPLVTEDGSNSGKAVSSPIVTTPAIFPAKSHNNDVATISGRITNVANNVVPPRIYNKLAIEFVDLLVGRKTGLGAPIDAADVIEIQDRPMQRARSEMVRSTMTTLPTNQLTCFIKTEPYPALNDPRNITTCNAEVTIQMSRYTYAFKEDILKDLAWYSPGKTPNEICNQLSTIADVNGSLLETDYSRFDGTISQFLQNRIVRAAYMRWVAKSERFNLEYLFSQVFMRKAITSSGLRFDPGWGTRSGSPITTDGNTMINAFVTYCAYRKLDLAPQDAWDRLNQAIFCGDDGLQPAYPNQPQMVESVAQQLGLRLKSVVASAMEPVTYLGRIFPCLAVTPTSCQDILRTLPKLHLTASNVEDRKQAAYNKACGYHVTDGKTPIIGDWAERVKALTPKCRLAKLTTEEAFKLQHPWPQPDEELLSDYVCRIMDLTGRELNQLRESIRAAQDIDSFPIIYENIVEDRVQAAVGDDLRGPTVVINNNSDTICPIASNSSKPMKSHVRKQAKRSPKSAKTSSGNEGPSQTKRKTSGSNSTKPKSKPRSAKRAASYRNSSGPNDERNHGKPVVN